MKIHKVRYFPKIEIYGKESVVNVQNSETGSSNALTVIIFLVKAYS